MKSSIHHTISRCGLPLVATSNSPHLCFIVDTGATHNILFSFVLDALNKKYKLIEKTHSVVGINGNPVDVPLIEVPLCFENIKAISIFSVLDASPAIFTPRVGYRYTAS